MEPWDFEGDPKNARTDRPQPAPASPTVSALLQELVSALDEKRSASEDPVQTVETAERSFAATDRIWALLEPARRALQSAQPAPIPMILHCPNCGLQHIDAPEHQDPNERDFGMTTAESRVWTNPPHKSHLCAGCKHIWRPADVPTTGVKEIRTKGKNDSPDPGRWTEQQHVLYTDKDADRPKAICDRNGQVVLAMCRHCGKGEADLDAGPCPGRGMA